MASIISPSFMMDLRTRVQDIAEDQYVTLLKDMWWTRVARLAPSVTQRERLTWLLNTATIELDESRNSKAIFEEMARISFEIENSGATAGLKIKREELEDLDGGIPGGLGMRTAAQWARDFAAQAAYWPQKLTADIIKGNPLCYDGSTLFATTHQVHPLDAARGTFANDFTGAASGTYPGAVPIDMSVTTEVALNNLSRVVAYLRSIKMPNGRDPRNLRVGALLVPPALAARAMQLTNAQQLVQSAATGALAGDVRAIISYLNYGQPIVAPELGADYGGSDTTYYVIAEDVRNSQLGAVVYQQREAFSIAYAGPDTDAQLLVANEFAWLGRGRNAAAPGHPYLMFRCRAS